MSEATGKSASVTVAVFENGQTCPVIDPRFIYLALALSAFGGAMYVRDTLRGDTSPNRVTWSLWGLEGVLAFVIERQQHVGLASWMTLMLGFVPIVVVMSSFRNPHSVWKIRPFDIFCGAISLAGLAFWAFVNEPTIALISFVCADQIAALPTLRKAWLAPSTESPIAFFMGFLNCTITVLTLKVFTSAGVLFPGCIAVTDFVLTLVIISKVGPRFRGESVSLPPVRA